MKTTAMAAEERVRYMTQAPVRRLILEMSAPTVISMLVTSFYNMADTLFVGQLDTQSTAAVGVAYSAMALLQAISFFFGHGSGNYISRQLGARNYEAAERMAATGFFSALLAGCGIAALGVAFITPISRLLGSTPTILPYTVAYLRVIFLGAPFLIGAFVLNNQMRFQGSASISMVGIMTGAVLNVVLDPVLIFGLKMGVAGAAWATSISQLVSFVVLLVLNRRRAAIKVRLSRFTPQPHYFYKIFTGGVPSLCRQGVGSIATVLLNLAAGHCCDGRCEPYLDVRKLGAYWLWAGLPASVRHKLRRRQTHPRAAGVLLLHPPGLWHGGGAVGAGLRFRTAADPVVPG